MSTNFNNSDHKPESEFEKFRVVLKKPFEINNNSINDKDEPREKNKYSREESYDG